MYLFVKGFHIKNSYRGNASFYVVTTQVRERATERFPVLSAEGYHSAAVMCLVELEEISH